MRQSTYLTLLSLSSSLALTGASPLPLSQRNTVLNEFLSDLLNYLPDINTTINDATTIITDLDALLAKLIGATTTENQLISGAGSCAEYTLIWARGTSEPGNMGVLVGPPLVWALQDVVGKSGLTIQGVNDYSASVDGYLEGGDPSGSANMYAFFTPLGVVLSLIIVNWIGHRSSQRHTPPAQKQNSLPPDTRRAAR